MIYDREPDGPCMCGGCSSCAPQHAFDDDDEHTRTDDLTSSAEQARHDVVGEDDDLPF